MNGETRLETDIDSSEYESKYGNEKINLLSQQQNLSKKTAENKPQSIESAFVVEFKRKFTYITNNNK